MLTCSSPSARASLHPLLKACRRCVLWHRFAVPSPLQRSHARQVTLLHVPGLADASSSAARAALAAGDDAAAVRLLHPAVLAYARQHELYAS